MEIKVIVTIKQSNEKNCYEGLFIVNENKISYEIIFHKPFTEIKKDHAFGRKHKPIIIKSFKLTTTTLSTKEGKVKVSNEISKFLISKIIIMIDDYNKSPKITNFNKNKKGFELLNPLNTLAKEVGSSVSLEVTRSFTCDEKLIPFELKNKKTLII